MNVSITEYGAIADGSLCTRAIQAAIDDCFQHGGGVVEIPAGTFLTGTIELRSNITLRLRSGARLCGSRNIEDYLMDPRTLPDCTWDPVPHKSSDFFRNPFSRWNCGLIRAFRAENVSIIGETDSIIDGMDCFDERGEEFYRGPHGINMHQCRHLTFSGYTVRNTGNWAHALMACQDIVMENVTVLAGHDGVHITGCDRVRVENCGFYTGDDCVAGIDNIDLTVAHCVMNTACSAFRLGGRHIRIRDCRLYGPAKYLFRGSLTQEEKRSGKPTTEASHRYNMLSAYTYYSDFMWDIREQPGDIEMTDCIVENVDRFLHFNFSGNEPWQRNRPLESIRFEGITASGLKYPLTAYGDPEIPVRCAIKNCRFSLSEEKEGMSFMHICHYREIALKDVHVSNLNNAPLILRWSKGELTVENLTWDDAECPLIRDAEFEFQCRPI